MHYVFNPNHYIDIVIASTTLLYKYKDMKVSIIFRNTFQFKKKRGTLIDVVIQNNVQDGFYTASMT